MSQSIAFLPVTIHFPKRSRRLDQAIGLIVSGTLVCLVFLLLSSSAIAAQPPNFLTASHGVTAPPGARQLCRTYPWACSRSPQASTVSAADLSVIKDVNRTINRSVRFLEDRRQHGEQERWSLPTARGGDCEDFALVKKKELIRRGVPAQALLIATALDRQRRGHAVLIVRTDGGDLVLDNLTDRVKKWSETGYVFLRMQNPSAPNGWVSVVSAN